MTSFLCTGDLHLFEHGPTLDWLHRQEQMLEQIARVAVDEDVDAVLFAGDAFERRRPDPAELLVFGRFVESLDGIPVVAIPGNHDVIAADHACALELFHRPDGNYGGFHLYRTPAVHRFAGVSVACLPWVPVSYLVSQVGSDIPRDEVYTVAAEHLVSVAAGLRERVLDGDTAVLLAHWSVSGSSLPSGMPVDQLREVVLPLAGLEEQGWDTVALGHIHQSQEFGNAGPVFYVGSPGALNFGEERSEHGCWLLDLDGKVPVAEFRPLDGPRFVTVDSAAVEDWPDMATLADAIVRVRYELTEQEAAGCDHALIRDEFMRLGAASVTVQPTIIRESRARVAGLDESLGEVEALAAWSVAERLDEKVALVLRDRLIADLQGVA